MTKVQQQPLSQLFNDINYAWQLLQSQIKLQTSDNVTGEDISNLLQLYMRGVEKMNSTLDYRETFFKNKVTSLMSRPTVIKSLNKPMSKKKQQAPVIQTIPIKKVEEQRNDLQLQEKKKQLQMRLAYGAQQHNPDALKKLINQQTQKQITIVKKIHNIVNNHEQKLLQRIKQRKLKTLTAKSRSQMYMNNQTNDTNGIDFYEKKQIMEKKRDQEQFGSPDKQNHKKIKQKIASKRAKSLEVKRNIVYQQIESSPSKRKISVDFIDQKIKKY